MLVNLKLITIKKRAMSLERSVITLRQQKKEGQNRKYIETESR